MRIAWLLLNVEMKSSAHVTCSLKKGKKKCSATRYHTFSYQVGGSLGLQTHLSPIPSFVGLLPLPLPQNPPIARKPAKP